ncbi:hypothetical protein L9G15_23310, partial [Shewanella sp. A3A]|nr:hypothetical protein [Shewanella ferrihydritica]
MNVRKHLPGVPEARPTNFRLLTTLKVSHPSFSDGFDAFFVIFGLLQSKLLAIFVIGLRFDRIGNSRPHRCPNGKYGQG